MKSINDATYTDGEPVEPPIIVDGGSGCKTMNF